MTSENTLNEIVKILEKFELQNKKFVYNLTTDTASVMTKLIKLVISPFLIAFKDPIVEYSIKITF